MDHIDLHPHVQTVAVNFFDTTIDVKKYSCSLNYKESNLIDPYVNLFINITDVCQANCGFCEYHKDTRRKFDMNKLKLILQELKNKNIVINKINFSGGEPMLEYEIIKEILTFIPDTFTTINTNGLNFDKLKDIKVDCIALSRHHYDDDLNNEIFKCNTPTLKELTDFPYKNRLQLRCNMIKGYIDSQEEAIKYIDVMTETGSFDFGFVSLMPVNDFCKENFFDSKELDWHSTGRTMHSHTQNRVGVCECKNFLYYTESGNMIKMYTRINEDIMYEASNIVFDIDHLKQGFNGDKII